MANEEEILKELRKMSKILIMSNGANLERELSKYATNDDRKRMWVLIDGNRQADDIVKATGLRKSAVYGFLKNLEDAQLIERQHGKPPIKTIDFVPAGWLELIQTSQAPNDESKQNNVPQNQMEIGDQNG